MCAAGLAWIVKRSRNLHLLLLTCPFRSMPSAPSHCLTYHVASETQHSMKKHESDIIAHSCDFRGLGLYRFAAPGCTCPGRTTCTSKQLSPAISHSCCPTGPPSSQIIRESYVPDENGNNGPLNGSVRQRDQHVGHAPLPWPFLCRSKRCT